jgi:hypothetical protein
VYVVSYLKVRWNTRYLKTTVAGGGAFRGVPNPGFHLTAAPVARRVAGGSLAQPRVNDRPSGRDSESWGAPERQWRCLSRQMEAT